MDSSSAHVENYWQIPPSDAHLQRCENPPCEATHNNNTPHRSAPAHTPTCRSKKLASTPPELAGACAAAPALRPRRPAGQRLSLHLGGPGTPGVPISYRGAGRPPEQGRCALHRARGGGAHRAGPCAAARAGARRCRAALQNCAGHGARFFHAAAARAGARRFNRARAHVPGTEHASPGGRPRAPHAAVPSAALHLRGHFAKLPSARISLLSSLLTVATPYPDVGIPLSKTQRFDS